MRHQFVRAHGLAKQQGQLSPKFRNTENLPDTEVISVSHFFYELDKSFFTLQEGFKVHIPTSDELKMSWVFRQVEGNTEICCNKNL